MSSAETRPPKADSLESRLLREIHALAQQQRLDHERIARLEREVDAIDRRARPYGDGSGGILDRREGRRR